MGFWPYTRLSTWIKDVFPETGAGPGDRGLPSGILDRVRPTIDVYGWSRFADIRHAVTESAAAASDVTWLVDGVAPVPAGKVRCVLYLAGFHDDGVHVLSFRITPFLAGSKVGITKAESIGANIQQAVERPVFLWPASELNLSSTDAMAAGKKLFIRGSFVDVPLGEVFNPYG